MFEKGKEKTGGRKKGTKNATTKTAKELMRKYVDSELKKMPSLLRHLTPKERLDVLAKILPYAYAKEPEANPKAELNALLTNIEVLSENQLLRLKQIIINCNPDAQSLN